MYIRKAQSAKRIALRAARQAGKGNQRDERDGEKAEDGGRRTEIRGRGSEDRGQNFGLRIANCGFLKKQKKRDSTVGAAFSRDLAVSTNFLILQLTN
jgi:hypothetical protein